MTAINRILIVDDEDNVRRMLSTAFALQGFETHCANNGRTALHLFADIHPDVVLMDIRMPEMDGHQTIKVDIRIIAATNRDLQAMVKEGTFREDLFYRLNVIHLILPPLRDRREDISLLANHFLQKFSSENQRDIIDIDPMAMSLLTAWSWPGNIRELSNVIERAVVMNSGPIIFSEDLPPQIRQPVCNAGEAKTAPVGERNLKEEIKRVEKRIIMEVLEQQEGNRTRTALMLGISRRALMYKLQEYGIDPADV
ncbi:TPA: response regulator [Escherichia coli]|nr:response regulator [Escherichia coli]